jgi:hypothetical protein
MTQDVSSQHGIWFRTRPDSGAPDLRRERFSPTESVPAAAVRDLSQDIYRQGSAGTPRNATSPPRRASPRPMLQMQAPTINRQRPSPQLQPSDVNGARELTKQRNRTSNLAHGYSQDHSAQTRPRVLNTAKPMRNSLQHDSAAKQTLPLPPPPRDRIGAHHESPKVVAASPPVNMPIATDDDVDWLMVSKDAVFQQLMNSNGEEDEAKNNCGQVKKLFAGRHLVGKELTC